MIQKFCVKSQKLLPKIFQSVYFFNKKNLRNTKNKKNTKKNTKLKKNNNN